MAGRRFIDFDDNGLALIAALVAVVAICALLLVVWP